MARILGIDIGQDAIRATLLRASFRQLEPMQYFEAALPAPRSTQRPDPFGAFRTPDDGVDDDDDVTAIPEDGIRESARDVMITEAVQDLLARVRPAPDRIIIGMDGRKASLRHVSVPKAAVKRAAEVLPYELESVLPFDVDDAVIDYVISKPGALETTLLACAVPKDEIRETLQTHARWGIEPHAITLGTTVVAELVQLIPDLCAPGLALASSSGEEDATVGGSAGSVLVLETDGERVDVCALERFAATGKKALPQTLVSSARCVSTGPADGAAFFGELRRTLAGFRAQGVAEPTRIWVCGAGSDEDFRHSLESALGLPTSALYLPDATSGQLTVGPAFAVSTALACFGARKQGGINLRRGEFTPKVSSAGLKQHGPLLGISAAAILTTFLFSVYVNWSMVTDDHERLKTELETVTEQAFGTSAKTAARAKELLERGPKLNDPLPRFDAYDLLDAVSQLVPKEISHDTRRFRAELDEDGFRGTFEVEGTVGSIAETDQIVAALEGHECIKEIEKGPTRPGRGGSGISYEIEGKFECPGAPQPEGKKRRRGRN